MLYKIGHFIKYIRKKHLPFIIIIILLLLLETGIPGRVLLDLFPSVIPHCCLSISEGAIW